MIVAFYLADMSQKKQGEFFESVLHFASKTFDIKISDDGILTIDGNEDSVSYSIGEKPNEYTPQEAYQDYIKTTRFMSYVKSKFYTLYTIKPLN